MGESGLCSEKQEKLPGLVRSTDCTYLCASALNPGGASEEMGGYVLLWLSWQFQTGAGKKLGHLDASWHLCSDLCFFTEC